MRISEFQPPQIDSFACIIGHCGRSVELETFFMRDESAGFTVTCPNFFAGANATVTDFRFQLDTRHRSELI